jgi:hypothetical protein
MWLADREGNRKVSASVRRHSIRVGPQGISGSQEARNGRSALGDVTRLHHEVAESNFHSREPRICIPILRTLYKIALFKPKIFQPFYPFFTKYLR